MRKTSEYHIQRHAKYIRQHWLAIYRLDIMCSVIAMQKDFGCLHTDNWDCQQSYTHLPTSLAVFV